jgi:hypothetical protein
MSLPVSRLLTDTITVSTRTGLSGSGDPLWSASTTLSARVERVDKLVVDATGTEVRAQHRIATTTELDREARVWLPGDDTGDADAARRPILVTKASTPSAGTTLWEVLL